MFRLLLPVLLLAFSTTLASAQERPNIVLIMADDLGYETVGCYGGESYRTPRLDRLAEQGLRFDRAYAMPLCTNTRIQLMTGKFNSRNWSAFGILDPQDKTFGHLMQQAGYKTCIAGKWQLTSYDPPDYPGAERRRSTGTHPRDAGFDEYSLWHVGHTEEKGSRYADPVYEQNGQLLTDNAGKYGPDQWTDFINGFMERHRDDPFFVYYSMALPHNPMVPTPDSDEWQDPARRHSDETPFAADMIEYTDKMIGKIVDQIDSLGLARKTLVLVYSDNGTNYRVTSKFRGKMVTGGKGKGTELGIRVPAFARWTGKIEPGTVSQGLFDSVDFLPTILDAAGASEHVPNDVDGFSFLDHITTQKPAPRRWVYIHQDPRPGWDKDRFHLIRLALDERYKLYEDGRLFDLRDDPFEQTPTFPLEDDKNSSRGRGRLQLVLDSMKPYPLFDPAVVPRPDPNEPHRDWRFQDRGGYVVIEAEQLPTPRDESWVVEGHASGYRGLGYVRALRDQTESPSKGSTHIGVIVDNKNPWRVRIRCRSDHAAGSQRQFWFKSEQSDWRLVAIPDGVKPGEWTWVDPIDSADGTVELRERGNDFWIAPASANLKVDRIVIYEDDQAGKALDLATQVSEYHPWASP